MNAALLFSILLTTGAAAPGSKTPELKVKIPPAPAGFVLKGDATAGHKIYKTYCIVCHGKHGNGHGLAASGLNPKPRDFTDKSFLARTDWQLYHGVKVGGAKLGLSATMTPFGQTLKDDQVRNVVAFIKQFQKRSAPKAVPSKKGSAK